FVGGRRKRAVADFGAVEARRTGADILEADAAFGEDRGGAGDVPIGGAAADAGRIEHARCHLHQPVGEGRIIGAAGVVEPGLLQLAMYGGGGCDRQRTARQAPAHYRRAVEAGAAALRSLVELVAGRRVDDTGDRDATSDDRQGYRPAVLAADEAARAIDRIDDED